MGQQRTIYVAVLVGFIMCLATGAQVVVVTPHNASIRFEFGVGFARWHKEKFGEPAFVEWRDVGGTADALKFVLSEFAAKPGGIGIDCFFGGGPEPLLVLADRGLVTPCFLPEEVLAGVPQQVNGVEIYDPGHRWYGSALSSFGILQNVKLQLRLGLPYVTKWGDLRDPRLYGWVGIGDPRNSGTMNNMFEAFLQAYGWERGWRALTEIAANARKFDRLSSTTAKDVTLGETVYGFAIDFYAFVQIAAAGRSNLVFVLPEDFSAVSIDGVCVLRGSPHPLLAERFVEFVMSEAGQKLWFLPRGHPEGPIRYSIERMCVRPDFYSRFRGISNIEQSPFERRWSFRYNPELARRRRDVVAALAGALLVDPLPELRRAWRVLMHEPPDSPSRNELGRVPLTESEALALSRNEWNDVRLRNQMCLRWQCEALDRYRRLAMQRERNTGVSTN
ncbi:MAG: ABC transporter substrate-binding protein [Verrucomicrobiae bacterium]|nr:ABC transporter substrate-binding protein [Verrucomicrobiae bacterium]